MDSFETKEREILEKSDKVMTEFKKTAEEVGNALYNIYVKLPANLCVKMMNNFKK